MSRLYAAVIWLLDPDRAFRVYLALLVLGMMALGLRLLLT